MAFGDVNCNVAKSKGAEIGIIRQGGNVFHIATDVTVTVQSVTGDPGLSAVMSSHNILFIQGMWESFSVGFYTQPVTSRVMVNSSVPGEHSGTVTYLATGIDPSNNPVTLSDTMQVTWTTGICDSTAPTTTTSATVPNGTGTSPYTVSSWTNKDVTLSLSAEDDTDGSGVKEIRYTSDGTDPSPTSQLYEGPITRSSTTNLKYRAYDNADNAEAVKSFQINIDKTNPTLTVSHAGANSNGWNTNSPVTLSVSASDSGGSGLTGAPTCKDGTTNLTVSGSSGNWTTTVAGDGTHGVTCTATDGANNSASGGDTVKIDTTRPTVSLFRAIQGTADLFSDASPYAADTWTNKDVRVEWRCADNAGGSGLSAGSPTGQIQTRLGETSASGVTVTYSDTCVDNAGNTAMQPPSFGPVKIDKTKPTVTVPANIIKEATGPSGAAATYSGVTANDNLDANPHVNCTPSSGSTFPLGTTTVNCTGTDKAGNTASGSFDVTVQDTTAPDITVPANKTVEATSATGAAVSFASEVSATDTVDGPVSVTCSPNSGSTFAIGTTAVSCSATDAHHNTATKSFTINVHDTTAPTLGTHADVNATATSSTGEVVNYTRPNATDTVDSNPTVSCAPVSGATFPVGTTTVSCTAKDATGNTSAGTFKVNVAYAWSNFLQPINVSGTQSVFKLGSTVPVKFNLTGPSAGITDGTFYIKYVRTGSGDGAGEAEAVSTSASTTGNLFRYDATAGQYILNWGTKSVSQAGNYDIRVYTDSAGTNLLGSVTVELKK